MHNFRNCSFLISLIMPISALPLTHETVPRDRSRPQPALFARGVYHSTSGGHGGWTVAWLLESLPPENTMAKRTVCKGYHALPFRGIVEEGLACSLSLACESSE